MSKVILNHADHLARLLSQAETNQPAEVKTLLDYLIRYKASNYPEVILKHGIHLVEMHPATIDGDSKPNTINCRLLPG